MLSENERRLLKISYDHKLSHLGSCLTALPIIEEIYATKKPEEKFVLSSGHAHLAHLVVMERLGNGNAEERLERAGIHCDASVGCDISTGSLGQGLPIAVGMALADRSKDVYCLVSDGECAEGSIWEAFEVAHSQKLKNLKIHVNANGFGAYDAINTDRLVQKLSNYDLSISVHITNLDKFPFLQGLSAHYLVMSREQYESTK